MVYIFVLILHFREEKGVSRDGLSGERAERSTVSGPATAVRPLRMKLRGRDIFRRNRQNERREVLDAAPSASHLQKGSDDCTYHVPKEAVSRYAEIKVPSVRRC